MILPVPDTATDQTKATVRIVAPPSVELSLLIGDAVHNLRAALDHVVYEIAEGACVGSLTENAVLVVRPLIRGAGRIVEQRGSTNVPLLWKSGTS